LQTRHGRTRVQDDAIDIDYQADVADAGQAQLGVRLQVAATAGAVDAWLTLTAHVDFLTCRSGLSARVPLRRVAGREVVVTHADGRCETTVLPWLISPSQPLFDIRRLRYVPGARQPVELLLEGDTFEMEDQRNWSDASFKIYNRPLALPTPYLLQVGQVVKQHVRIALLAPEDTI